VVRFATTILPAPLGTFVIIPDEVVAALKVKGRTSVVGTIDGQPFRNQFMPYDFDGEGRKIAMVVNRAVRTALGKDAGDEVVFELERDLRSRSADIVIPEELVAALAADPVARTRFEALAPTHRRDHAEHVAQAKRPETRVRRAAKTVDSLRGPSETR
jgi:hypothetical protein